MCKTLVFLFFFFTIIGQVRSQILPKEGRALNYRLIGFSFPPEKKESICCLEIAKGNFYTEDSFKKNIIKNLRFKGNKIIAEVPWFGSEYTWRVVYVDNEQKIKENVLHHFSTLFSPEIDTSNLCLRITQAAKKYKDAYVFLDDNKALYDMNGHAVWFLPGETFAQENVRDLKETPFGTITFMLKDKEQIFEINYEGDILWQGPNTGIVSGNTTEHYHHEFTRLTNGHYMVLGNEMPWEKPMFKSNTDTDTNVYHTSEPLPTIIEYDSNGKVVWSWRSSGYFRTSDLINFNTKYFTQKVPVDVDVHANSFYFDEKARTIYISCKDISRIIKLKYPEGTVLNMYGELFKRGVPEQFNGLFCNQHSVKHSKNGYIYLLQNTLLSFIRFLVPYQLFERFLVFNNTCPVLRRYFPFFFTRHPFFRNSTP